MWNIETLRQTRVKLRESYGLPQRTDETPKQPVNSP